MNYDMDVCLTGRYCLNPCSNGMLMEQQWLALIASTTSLNPCSNGMLMERYTLR